MNNHDDQYFSQQQVSAKTPLQISRDLFVRLKKRLDHIECDAGRKLTQKQFGELLGVPRSTINDWFVDPLPGPIGALIRALERLPESDRCLFLRDVCRDCPRLRHPWLAHDPKAVAALERVLNQRHSLTVITGRPKRLRTFLLMAFGNSVARIDAQRRCCGLDVNPLEFAPVPGVDYVSDRNKSVPIQSLISETWSRIMHSQSEVVLLNGVLSIAQQLGPEIVECSHARHVILTDDLPSDFPAMPTCVIRVAADKYQSQLLRVSIH